MPIKDQPYYIFYTVECFCLCGIGFMYSEFGVYLFNTKAEAEEELADTLEFDPDQEDFVTKVYANTLGQIWTDEHTWETLEAHMKSQYFDPDEYRLVVQQLIKEKKRGC